MTYIDFIGPLTPEQRKEYQRQRKTLNAANYRARLAAAGIKRPRKDNRPRKGPRQPKPKLPLVEKKGANTKKAILLRERFFEWLEEKNTPLCPRSNTRFAQQNP